MPFLIGTDEAGYGPNLGPLVITGTLWKVPSTDDCLFDLLADAISENSSKNRIKVCDSKSLYQSGGSIGPLESSVLSLLGTIPTNWRRLIKDLNCESTHRNEVWLSGAKLELPLKADPTVIGQHQNLFQKTCQTAGVELVAVQPVTLFANDFNAGVEQLGNKATVLSNATLKIVKKLLLQTNGDHVRIICDKHGGRSKYAGVLQHCVTDSPVVIDCESLETSQYHWKQAGADIQAEFNARGESSVPVALASMVSKYVREVYMKLWNQFWSAHLPNIKPTKGYPQDAKRFMKEIESTRDQLNISRESVWRSR